MKTPRSHSAMMVLVAGTTLVLVASLAWHFLGGRIASGGGKLVAQAAQLASQGDAAGAEAAYRQILASDPANLDARHALARLADERAAAQEASMTQAPATLPPESPEILTGKVAAAQARMDVLKNQYFGANQLAASNTPVTAPAVSSPSSATPQPAPGTPPAIAESPEAMRKRGEEKFKRYMETYSPGKAVTDDLREARDLLLRAAELGDGEACFAIGALFSPALVIPELRALIGEADEAKSMMWVRKAAEKGSFDPRLRSIAFDVLIACKSYAIEHSDRFPESLDLLPVTRPSPRPNSPPFLPAESLAQLRDVRISGADDKSLTGFDYHGSSLTRNAPDSEIVFASRATIGGKRVVVTMDGKLSLSESVPALAAATTPPATFAPAIAPPSAPPAAADSRALYEYIDGINPGTGTFTLTSAGRWIERCPDGNIFEFEEKARQPGFIELHDATRLVSIRLQAKGTLVHQTGVADGGWQELYPGGWRDKTRPSSPKVVVRMIPEDVGLDITKRAMKEKPADESRAKASQTSSRKQPGNDELPSAALPPDDGEAMDANRALDPQAQDLKLLQGVWECVATYKDNVSVPDYVGIKAVIQGTRLTWIYPKPAGKDEIEEASFTIDAAQSPKHFDWHYVKQGQDQLRRRIYFVDQNTLRWGSGGGKVGAHPVSFEQSSWEFRCKRVRPADGDTASQIQMKPTN